MSEVSLSEQKEQLLQAIRMWLQKQQQARSNAEGDTLKK